MNKGQRVYGEHGEEAVYVGTVDGKHVVCPIVFETNYEGEPMEVESSETVWRKAYAEPPKPKLQQQVANAAAELAEVLRRVEDARGAVRGLQNEVRAATEERDRLRKTLRDVPALKRLDQFLSGRITHAVLLCGYDVPKVVTWESMKQRDSDRSYEKPAFPLVSLFGKSDGNLECRINRYSDGSGSWTTFIPCESEEEAKAIALSEAEKLIAGWDGKGWPHRAVEAAKAFGLQLPAEMQKLVVARARDALARAEKDAQELKATAERARAALLAAEVALADAGNSQL